jgi:hypothetical protein
MKTRHDHSRCCACSRAMKMLLSRAIALQIRMTIRARRIARSATPDTRAINVMRGALLACSKSASHVCAQQQRSIGQRAAATTRHFRNCLAHKSLRQHLDDVLVARSRLIVMSLCLLPFDDLAPRLLARHWAVMKRDAQCFVVVEATRLLVARAAPMRVMLHAS